jgi:hypothetical protein
MIDYSIKKPHALAGHFIKINNEAEYNEMREIAEGCGFEVDSYDECLKAYQFYNDMRLRWISLIMSATQEITLPELRELATLSKLTFPMEMEVWDDKNIVQKKYVIDFYKGKPVVNCDLAEMHYTYKHYRMPNPNTDEIEKLEKEIEGLKARINTLKGEETK